MKKLFLFLAFLAWGVFLCTFSTPAQTLTQVTGTITDPNGLPYSNALVNIALVPSGGPSPTYTPCTSGVGCPFTPSSVVTADATGKFTVALYANASILPSGTQWQFNVTEPGVAPPWGKGAQFFSYTVTISGSSQSISSGLSAAAPALTPAFSGGGGFTASGDLTGTSSSQTVVGLENLALPTLAASTGYFYDSGGTLSLSTSASNFTTGTLPHAQLPALVSADIPNNAANTTGNATTASAFAATPSLCPGGQVAAGVTAAGNATGCVSNSPGAIVYSTKSSISSASLSATTMAVAGGSAGPLNAGADYRFSFYFNVAGLGVGCTAATTVAVNLIYTDPLGSGSTTLSTGALALTASPNFSGVSGTAPYAAITAPYTFTFRAGIGTNIQFSTTYSATGSGCSSTVSYQLYPILEQLTSS